MGGLTTGFGGIGGGVGIEDVAAASVSMKSGSFGKGFEDPSAKSLAKSSSSSL